MNLAQDLLTTARRLSRHTAIHLDDKAISYSSLLKAAQKVSAVLNRTNDKVGLLCYRDFGYYSCVFACLTTNKTFVPLGIKFPVKRLKSIIEQSGVKEVVFSARYNHLVKQLARTLPAIKFICFDEINIKEADKQLLQYETSSIAYILYTSGSTGLPKGVPITTKNLAAYTYYMVDFLSVKESDNISQVFDPTFDLSIHDMVITWLAGACLFPLPESALFAPGKFIKTNQLTIWFCVPATAAIMAKLGMLKENSYPSLRLSLFCGEPLTVDLAQKFQEAASESKLINLYGPTEATIACSSHLFDKNREYLNSYVPIGTPFPHIKFSIDRYKQLIISGSQVFDGYLNNQQQTSTALFKNNCENHYRTGDIVNINKLGEYEYIARIDDQVKIQGYRIELSEIDSLARSFLDNQLVISLAIPRKTPEQIALFICGPVDKPKENQLIEYLKASLPSYMLPKKYIWLDSIPLNSNGKIDKLALYNTVEIK